MNFRDESGSAVIELLFFGVVLQVPLLVLSLHLGDVQSRQFAADSVARHALRSFVLFRTPVNEAAIEIAGQFGLEMEPKVYLVCKPDCETEGAIAALTVTFTEVQGTSKSVIR